MNSVSTVIVVVFVLSVLATAVYTLYSMSPFAHHADRFRDPQTGKRLGDTPRLTHNSLKD